MNTLLEIITVTLVTAICTAVLAIILLYMGWWSPLLIILIIVISCLLAKGNGVDE